MTIVTSSSALQKGLLARVQGQMAPAWILHPGDTLLKPKPSDNVTRHHQSVCAIHTFEFKTSPQSSAALKTAAPGSVTQDRHFQKPRLRGSALSLLSPAVWVKRASR